MNIGDVEDLLCSTSEAQSELFQKAGAIRDLSWSNRAIIRGVIEITNLCRVNCEYCPMRRDNIPIVSTYTMTSDEIVAVSKTIRDHGINVVFLQGGEIPQTTKIVGEAIPRIKELYEGHVEILLCLGNKKKSEYKYLRCQGADSYILKHETSDSALHASLRHESLHSRLQHLEWLLELGFKVGTGTIVGLPGQTKTSIAEDILLAHRLGVHMASASPFVPAPNTPLHLCQPGSFNIATNAIAVMRLIQPTWLIPSVSALEKLQEGGQLIGLHAGANVLTVNFTPPSWQKDYLIYGKDRYLVKLEHVRSLLRIANLEFSGSAWVKS